MKPGPDYNPNLPVPSRWHGCELEYRHGWSWGGRPWIRNPVKHNTEEMDDAGLPDRRDAWAAGRKDFRASAPTSSESDTTTGGEG